MGTGKTTVSRCLLQQLPAETEIAYILNPSLTERDLLAAICDEFQLPYAQEASLKQLFDLIRDHLLANLAAGKRSVVLVDEAQHLLPGVLEQLRLLTNLETDEKKLLQVVLIGQPELQQMLRQPLLRQLAQRITARYHLLPLSRQDVDAYVRFRLQVAGCVQPIFTPKAIQTLHRLSGGIPRLINLICDRALIAAFARGSHKIVHGDISQSAYEVSGIRDEGTWQSGLLVALAGALLVATGWWGWQWFGVFPTRPLVKVEVPVKVDDTPEQQEQLTRAINQALDPGVAMQNLYRVWGYQTELEESTCDDAPAPAALPGGGSQPGTTAGAATPGPHQPDRRDRRPLLCHPGQPGAGQGLLAHRQSELAGGQAVALRRLGAVIPCCGACPRAG